MSQEKIISQDYFPSLECAFSYQRHREGNFRTSLPHYSLISTALQWWMHAAAEATASNRDSQGKPSTMFFAWQVQTESTAMEHWSLTAACRHLNSPNNNFKQASAFLISHLPTSSPDTIWLLTLTCTSDDFKHCVNFCYKPPLCYRSPQALCLQLNIPVRIYHPPAWQVFIFTRYKGAVKRLL